MGMFSLLDAFLDCPLDEALRSVSLNPDIAQVLLGTAADGNLLRMVHQLIRRYEIGDWDEVERLALVCGFPAAAVTEAYLEATLWANAMLHAVNTP
jgi:c-di-GMP phosphodiesterase